MYFSFFLKRLNWEKLNFQACCWKKWEMHMGCSREEDLAAQGKKEGLNLKEGRISFRENNWRENFIVLTVLILVCKLVEVCDTLTKKVKFEKVKFVSIWISFFVYYFQWTFKWTWKVSPTVCWTSMQNYSQYVNLFSAVCISFVNSAVCFFLWVRVLMLYRTNVNVCFTKNCVSFLWLL